MHGPATLAFLFAAGVVGGACNAAAGGGSFVTLPALVYAGMSPLAASAASTVSLFPGRVASAWVYRKDLGGFAGVSLRLMMAASLLGGLAGAVLLLCTSAHRFGVVMPWLLLTATAAFAGGPRLRARLRRSAGVHPGVLVGGQFVLCTYAGFFGGAVGILTMAFWSVVGVSDVKAMNAARTVLLGAASAVSVLCFIATRMTAWPFAAAMLAGAVVGGYAGAHFTRRIGVRQLQVGLTMFNVAVTGLFFARIW